MNREFQVLYRFKDGPLLEVRPVARDEDQVRALMARVAPDVVVLHVAVVRGIIDWDARNFDREEAGEYLRKSPQFVDKAMAAGALPRASKGYPIFTRAQLDALIGERMKAA